MKSALFFITFALATAAQAEQCPDLYCWGQVPATTETCAVRYEQDTGRCRSTCTGTFLGAPHPGDTFTKRCPGLPGYLTICVAYVEVQPVPLLSTEGLPDILYTLTEGEGQCAYLPAS